MFGSASQGGEQADQLYLGMLGSLIAFLWSAAEYLLFFVFTPYHHGPIGEHSLPRQPDQ
ncbi:MAG: hypothetical protein U9N60_02745 [Thermodesulfobacteriota bacterium]|nr:hypothetical protein [Thermodesulfobacteriota bacterium]